MAADKVSVAGQEGARRGVGLDWLGRGGFLQEHFAEAGADVHAAEDVQEKELAGGVDFKEVENAVGGFAQVYRAAMQVQGTQ